VFELIEWTFKGTVYFFYFAILATLWLVKAMIFGVVATIALTVAIVKVIQHYWTDRRYRTT
jgi:hypothetical protein